MKEIKTVGDFKALLNTFRSEMSLDEFYELLKKYDQESQWLIRKIQS